jgi:cytochrome c oxidase subunit 1
MATRDQSTAAVNQAPAAQGVGPFADRDLILTNLWVAIIAFGTAACMAVMQALSRASLEVPYRSPRMYYMSVTAHGILMALVFTTFFIMALGDAVVDT